MADNKKIVYEIMHKDRKVAVIDNSGRSKIYFKSFMPYNLYLEEDTDIDTLVNNITNNKIFFITIMLLIPFFKHILRDKKIILTFVYF